MVLPGTYEVRLSADGWSETRPLELRLDPRLAVDGVSVADLRELLDLQTKLLGAMREAHDAADRLLLARAGGPSRSNEVTQRLAALTGRLVTAGGPYPQPMLIDQLANVLRMLGQADQKPGRDAYLRYDDLRRELDALLAEVRAALGPEG
jgi:hypothetical protein